MQARAGILPNILNAQCFKDIAVNQKLESSIPVWGAKLDPTANVVRLVYGHLPGTPPIGAFLRDRVVSEMRTLLGLGQEPQDAAIILSFSGQACPFG